MGILAWIMTPNNGSRRSKAKESSSSIRSILLSVTIWTANLVAITGYTYSITSSSSTHLKRILSPQSSIIITNHPATVPHIPQRIQLHRNLCQFQLFGGYDATVLSSSTKSTPLQFFTPKIITSGSTITNHLLCPHSTRVLLVLRELDLPYDQSDVMLTTPSSLSSSEQKGSLQPPDWYLRMNPKGTLPAIRNPLDGTENVYSDDFISCARYLCDYSNSIRSSVEDGSDVSSVSPTAINCPSTSEEWERLTQFIEKFDPSTSLRSNMETLHYAYLLNTDRTQEEYVKQMMEGCLFQPYEQHLRLIHNIKTLHHQSDDCKKEDEYCTYMMGNIFSLADIYIIPTLYRLVVAMEQEKGYVVPKDQFPMMSRWLDSIRRRRVGINGGNRDTGGGEEEEGFGRVYREFLLNSN